MLRVNSLNSVLVNNQHVGDPVAGAECHREDDPCCLCQLDQHRVFRARWHCMDLAGEVIDVHLHLVKASCYWEAQQPVDPTQACPCEREAGGDAITVMEQAALAHVVALADLTGSVGFNVTVVLLPCLTLI